MIITARYGRKIGQPGYCSLDCGCSIQIELHRPTPETAKLEADRLFEMAKGWVDGQLREQEAAAAAAPSPARRAGAAAAKSWGSSSEGPRPQRPAGPAPAPVAGAGPRPPANGKQLYAWLRKREQATGQELLPGLQRWGDNAGCPRRMLDWDAAQTQAALAHLDGQHPQRN